MPSAALIRKKVVSVLQDRILPELQGDGPLRITVASLPLKTPPDVMLRELDQPMLTETESGRGYPHDLTWEGAKMHAIRFPYLNCVIEGEADLSFGVTKSMVKVASPGPDQCGGYVLSMAALSYLLIPPGVPFPTGEVLPWNRPEPHTDTLRLLKIRVLPVGALCHISTLRGMRYEKGYSLFVEDSQFAPAVGILLNELRGAKPDMGIARAQLQVFMLQLLRKLNACIPPLTDGLDSRFPDRLPHESGSQISNHPILGRAHDYIQLHLHEDLDPHIIARYLRLTPTHLNRIFRSELNTSIMRYVALQRMETAKLLLWTSDLPVQEISRLVGYRDLPHFSRSFQRHMGTAPLKFRQNQEHSQHEK